MCDLDLNDTPRLTFNPLISYAKVVTNLKICCWFDGQAQKYFGEPSDTALKTLITHFLTR